MFLFLIVLISCWVVAASFWAENTNVGVTVFDAYITSTCGIGSDGAAALLSANNNEVQVYSSIFNEPRITSTPPFSSKTLIENYYHVTSDIILPKKDIALDTISARPMFLLM